MQGLNLARVHLNRDAFPDLSAVLMGSGRGAAVT